MLSVATDRLVDWWRCRAPGQGREGRCCGAAILALGLAAWAASGVAGSRRADEDDPCPELQRARSLIRAGDLPSARALPRGLRRRGPPERGGLAHAGPRSLRASGISTRRRPPWRSRSSWTPAQPQAFKMLGRVHTARSKPALAERAFVEAARLGPEDAEARYLLGRLYQSEDRLVEAARFLKEAVALDPGSVRALAFLGTVSYGLGDTSLCQESFQRAVSLNRASKAPDAIPHLEYGIYLQRADRLEESVAELRRAAQLDALERRGPVRAGPEPAPAAAAGGGRRSPARGALPGRDRRPRALPPRPGLLRAGRPRLRGRAHEAVGETARALTAMRATAAARRRSCWRPASASPLPPRPRSGSRTSPRAPASTTSCATPRRPSGTRSSP